MISSSEYRAAKAFFIVHVIVLLQNLKSKFINTCIFISCNLGIYTYFFPKFGMSAEFGTFMFAGLYATAGFFEVFPNAVQFVADLEGDKEINQHLILPIPLRTIFAVKTLFFALCSATLSIISIPIGLLVVQDFSIITHLNPFYLIIISITNSLFYGAFALFMASILPSILELDNIWMRFVFPLWVWGSFEFSWHILYETVPYFAYINLLNPMTYVMEGTRAAFFAPQDYLSLGICVPTICAFTALFFLLALKILRKRLDFIP